MRLETALSRFQPHLLSLLRCAAGLCFLQHGTAKYLKFPRVPMYEHVEPLSQGGIAGMFELACGALLVVGLFTRPAAFLASGVMAFAYFLAHAPKGFYPVLNGGELSIIYCFVFLYLAAAGGGPWSLDAWVRRRG